MSLTPSPDVCAKPSSASSPAEDPTEGLSPAVSQGRVTGDLLLLVDDFAVAPVVKEPAVVVVSFSVANVA